MTCWVHDAWNTQIYEDAKWRTLKLIMVGLKLFAKRRIWRGNTYISGLWLSSYGHLVSTHATQNDIVHVTIPANSTCTCTSSSVTTLHHYNILSFCVKSILSNRSEQAITSIGRALFDANSLIDVTRDLRHRCWAGRRHRRAAAARTCRSSSCNRNICTNVAPNGLLIAKRNASEAARKSA